MVFNTHSYMLIAHCFASLVVAQCLHVAAKFARPIVEVHLPKLGVVVVKNVEDGKRLTSHQALSFGSVEVVVALAVARWWHSLLALPFQSLVVDFAGN